MRITLEWNKSLLSVEGDAFLFSGGVWVCDQYPFFVEKDDGLLVDFPELFGRLTSGEEAVDFSREFHMV